MAKIKALRNMIVEGKPVEEGKQVECSDRVAKYLVAIGKAELLEPKKAAGRETTEGSAGSEQADAPAAKKGK